VIEEKDLKEAEIGQGGGMGLEGGKEGDTAWKVN